MRPDEGIITVDTISKVPGVTVPNPDSAQSSSTVAVAPAATSMTLTPDVAAATPLDLTTAASLSMSWSNDEDTEGSNPNGRLALADDNDDDAGTCSSQEILLERTAVAGDGDFDDDDDASSQPLSSSAGGSSIDDDDDDDDDDTTSRDFMYPSLHPNMSLLSASSSSVLLEDAATSSAARLHVTTEDNSCASGTVTEDSAHNGVRRTCVKPQETLAGGHPGSVNHERAQIPLRHHRRECEDRATGSDCKASHSSSSTPTRVIHPPSSEEFLRIAGSKQMVIGPITETTTMATQGGQGILPIGDNSLSTTIQSHSHSVLHSMESNFESLHQGLPGDGSVASGGSYVSQTTVDFFEPTRLIDDENDDLGALVRQTMETTASEMQLPSCFALQQSEHVLPRSFLPGDDVQPTHSHLSLAPPHSPIVHKVHSSVLRDFIDPMLKSSPKPTSRNLTNHGHEDGDHGGSPCYRPAESRQNFELHEDEDEILDPEAQSVVSNFAAENRILLRAVWDLLAERDRHAPVVGMMDPVILKAGSLKKASHLVRGTWKVKYVEVRRGMFSYYEDAVSNMATSNCHPTNVTSKDNNNHQHLGDGDFVTPTNVTGGQLLRKDIPLDAQTCRCRPVKLHQKALNLAPGGAIFELSAGETKRLWMAKSREERQGWIVALNYAMVGGSVTRGDAANLFGTSSLPSIPFSTSGSEIADEDVPLPPSLRLDSLDSKQFAMLSVPFTQPSLPPPVEKKKALAVEDISVSERVGGSTASTFSAVRESNLPGSGTFTTIKLAASTVKSDLRVYIKVQSQLRNASNKAEYVRVLRSEMFSRPPLNVPVQWIAKQGFDANGGHFRDENMNMSVNQLFRDLRRDAVRINKELYRGDSHPHGAEQIIGAFVRSLLATANDMSDVGTNGGVRCDVGESQALSYARDILLAGNRTRSGGDSYFCINSLCRNDALVVIVPNAAVKTAPVQIRVAKDSVNAVSGVPVRDEKSGWIRTRGKLQRRWQKLFFVLSEGTLSYYEHAHPRPHGLKGQLLIADTAKLSVFRRKSKTDEDAPDQFVLSLITKENIKERYLLFRSEERLLEWAYAIEFVAQYTTHLDPQNVKKINRRRAGSVSSPLDSLQTPPEVTATREHAVSLDIDPTIVDQLVASFARRTSASLSVSVQAVTEYKVCTTDPQGDDASDTWALVQAQFLQNFRISGGQNGRLIRGEEIVRVKVVSCGAANAQSHISGTVSDTLAESFPGSPRRTRMGLSMRLRTFMADEEKLVLSD